MSKPEEDWEQKRFLESCSLPVLQSSHLLDVMNNCLMRIFQANTEPIPIDKFQLISWIALVARYLEATKASFPRGTIVIGKQLG